MKPPIPWLRVFIEGVVIVGSILLAFGLQAWWEGRQERAQGTAYLDGSDQRVPGEQGRLTVPCGPAVAETF